MFDSWSTIRYSSGGEKERMKKYSTIVTTIEEGRIKKKCHFIDKDDPYLLDKYEFEDYVKKVLDGTKDILEITCEGCKKAEELKVDISSNTIIIWIKGSLSSYPIEEHIDTKLVPKQLSEQPKKGELLSLFAKAITCLGYIGKYF